MPYNEHNKSQHNTPSRAVSAVTRAFLDNTTYLQSFLRRFLHRQQDIEDVAQEAYLKAYSAEQQSEVEHPKAFLFTIAKNIAINELRKKTHKVTGYIYEGAINALYHSMIYHLTCPSGVETRI